MRAQTKNNVTLKYPDEIGFAFNACLLIADGADLLRMTTKIGNGTKTEELFLDSFDGKCYCDVREYVQTFFDTMQFGAVDYQREVKTKMGVRLSFEVTITLLQGADVVFTFDVFYIWGALKIGGQETYNGFRTLTWFKGFPFTFGLYSAGGGSLLFSQDGVPNRFLSIPDMGVWNIPMLPGDNAKNHYLISDCVGQFFEVAFDKTFDMTFSYRFNGSKTDKIRINVVDSCSDGFYLRWINRHGFYCYYLFKAGAEQRKSESDNLFMRNNLLAFDMSYGYEGYTGRQQQMKREDTTPICAPLVDTETWDMLFDITTSPCVDLFAGYQGNVPKWVAVTVVAATYTKNKAALQDFVCNILMPDVNVQKL
ncbi:MAG: hypothetical protein PUG96_02470 [Prevotellaceae bacterium]|nr:hypothetical protein [Prevotella sp.]MDD7272817.1 hypothetical protein [Prevotellaceae bacterium]